MIKSDQCVALLPIDRQYSQAILNPDPAKRKGVKGPVQSARYMSSEAVETLWGRP